MHSVFETSKLSLLLLVEFARSVLNVEPILEPIFIDNPIITIAISINSVGVVYLC